MKSKRAAETDRLMQSLEHLWGVIEPVMVKAEPSSVCEVGLGRGEFSRLLIEFCRARGATYTGIDPAVREDLVDLRGSDSVRVHRCRSLEVLPSLPPQDVYLVDGDHNYYTVKRELEVITGGGDHGPVIFLHDLLWPWGRRDLYYDPEIIPRSGRHPFFLASEPVLDQIDTPESTAGAEEGGEGRVGVARVEGGPQNGVLTAVEDVMAGESAHGWKLLVVPVLYGMGILYRPDRCAAGLLSLLGKLSESLALLDPLLLTLERNRVDLTLSLLEDWRKGEEMMRALRESETMMGTLREREEHFRAIAGDFRGLLDSYNALRAHDDTLRRAFRELSEHTVRLQEAYRSLSSHAEALRAVSGKKESGGKTT